MRARPRRAASALSIVALVATGCGGGSSAGPTTPRGHGSGAAPAPSTPHGQGKQPSAKRAPAATERVIRRWSDTLRRGDVAGAARAFALPAIVQIDPAQQALELTRRVQVEAFNRLLPCGARLVRTEEQSGYAVALFRLVQRRGARCDAPGHTARTAFKVAAGHIVEWRRVPDAPGENAPASPPADSSAGPAV
jgi:hypothetical protein